MIMRLDVPKQLAAVFLALVATALGPAATPADPRLLRLNVATFDPLAGEPDFREVLPAGQPLRPASETAGRAYLIQFHDPLSAGVQEDLRARGIDVLGYVPDRALLVRLPPGVAEQVLRSTPGQRYVGPLLPGYKLAPDLLRQVRRTSPGGDLMLDVLLLAGENPDLLLRAIQARAPDVRVEFVKRSGVPRVTLAVPRAQLEPLESLIGSLAQDPAVSFVSRRLPLELHNDNAVWIGQSYDRIHGPAEAGESDPRLYAQSGTIWARGLTGAGQVIAVADTGLETGMCFFDDPAHPVTPQSVSPPGPLVLDAGHRKVLAYNAPLSSSLNTDATYRHGTHVAGSALGDSLDHPATEALAGHDHGDGMAPAAKLIFEDISGGVSSSCSTGIVVQSIEALLEQEHAAGARISTNSWGSSVDAASSRAGAGDGAVEGLEAETGAWQAEELLVVFSAGNNGGGGLGGYARCKSCLTVGATENYDGSFTDIFGILDPENMTNFSSRGPTADGRLKPDVVAPGYLVTSPRFPVQYTSNDSDPMCDSRDPEICFPSNGGCFRTDTAQECATGVLLGTSQAAPLVAGLAALARQYLTEGFHPTGSATPADVRTPSAALLKALLINGARNMTGHRYERRVTPVDFGPLLDAPSNTQGWGRVQLDDALYFDGDARRLQLFDLRHAQGLVTGTSIRVALDLAAADQPLKLTLVWSDPPGPAIALGSLVNDLDLELTAPDGSHYRGNQWTSDNVNLPGDKQSAPNPPGRDAVNNVEGILLQTPQPGLYTVTVHGVEVPGAPGFPGQGAALVATGAGLAPCTTTMAPANLTAEVQDGLGVALDWDAVPGALGYRLYRNSSTCSDPMAADLALSLPAGSTAHTDASLDPSTTYHYTVRAILGAPGCETEDSDCASATTPAAGPPAVPDGITGTPMRAKRRNPTGSSIDVTWDVGTCPASGYNLIFGNLADVEQLPVAGARCALGTSGAAGWSAVPAGDLWFLLVAHDGAGTEGSWGTRSDGSQRSGTSPSLQCGVTQRNNNAVCP